MAASTQSAEQRELSLIAKVEMRIALVDSDSKLESTLKTYLAPLLLKLDSRHQSVRQKVISVCQHVNTRVKPESVQLPVAVLVKQFKEQQSSLIRHFDLLYIQQGVNRLSAAEKAELLPTVLKDVSASGSHGPQIFNLFLRLLESFRLHPRGSKEDTEMRAQLAFSDEDVEYLTTWLGKLLLLTPPRSPSRTCPGLSAEDCSFLTLHGKEDTWNPALGGLNFLRTKTLGARLLATGLFHDDERFLPALYASADPASGISDTGDDMMKRILPATNLENKKLIKRLFDLYFGDGGAPRVRAPLRVKILGLLTKSTSSTTFTNRIIKLVDDIVAVPAMDGEDTVMGSGHVSNGSIGRETSKLRSSAFTYINFVARYGSTESLHAIAPQVIARLRDFVEDQGWPKPGVSEDLPSRGYAYEVIGLLAKAGARSVLVEEEQPALDLLRWLLNSLARDSSGSSIIVSIEESLSTVLAALSRLKLSPTEHGVLEDLLIDQMTQSADLEATKRLRSTRYVSVRFANRCLPYSSVKARWVNVLGIGAVTDRVEVREESERGLSPYWHKMLNGSTNNDGDEGVAFPAFVGVMQQFFPSRTLKDAVATAGAASEAYPHCISTMAGFARRTLLHEALATVSVRPTLDNDWERKIDAAADNDPEARLAIRARLADNTSSSMIEVLASTLLIVSTREMVPADDHSVPVLALAPNALIEKLVPFITVLIPILHSHHHSRRMRAAQAFGILASHPVAQTDQVRRHVQKLLQNVQQWKAAVGADTNKVHGAAVALSHFFSRKAGRGLETDKTAEYQAFVAAVFDIVLHATDGTIKEASFVALGQLCMFGHPGVEDPNLKTAVDKACDIARAGSELATLCIGQISMAVSNHSGDDNRELRHIEDTLHTLHEIRQIESQFAVGEAFSYLTSGWQSAALAAKLDIDVPQPEGPSRPQILSRVTDRIIADCSNTKPTLKKAAVIWLLCIVQFCGEQPEVQERLAKCQVAFKLCLSDRDELVQESASRGLGLVYEKGDRALKDSLVRDLVSSFSSDRQSQLAGNVSEDTQLFEPGALPTGEGSGSVSTYKDIMSLASEVGDSSLVYRFMSMASSNAIWSSRAAFGRFGLSNVLSDSSADGYLADNPRLYPKLFRYRFDPNGGVQRSMNDIWNTLVKDSSLIVNKHFDAIMEDLLTSILGKEWRVRQASCAAIADLVQGRPLEKYEKYLEQIWTKCFKVLDDIKESVRAAAASLARVLTGVLTRSLEADHSSTKTAAAMLKHVLPFLLSPSGMESSAQEVQLFSVHTLLEITKKSNGKTLRPFLPELVERLITLLSSLEPEAVNYIHLNASKYNLTEQKIDDMRLSSVRSSPIMEAVERCLDLLDEDCMRELRPRLESALKGAVGLPSKVGGSRILVSLSTRRNILFRPFADDFLKLIERLVLDRNETVSSSYAVAAGYIARSASDKQILRMSAFARQLYFETEGDRESPTPRRAITSGEIMYSLAKHASDRFSSLAAELLTFAFFGKHDSHEQVREQFQNTWNESVGGSRAVLLYLAEILKLCNIYLESPQWTLKHTAARSVADAVASMEGTMSKETADLLWPVIEKALGGKTWEGKEVVISAFAKFVEMGSSYYLSRPAVAAAIVKISVREAKRQNAGYRQYSVKALSRIAKARTDVDMSDQVLDIVDPLLSEPEANDTAMEIDSERHSSNADAVKEATRARALEALFASINPYVCKADQLRSKINRTFTTAARVQTNSMVVQKQLYEGINDLFKRVETEADVEFLDAGSVESLKGLLFRSGVRNEAMRMLRADAILSAVKCLPALAVHLRADILAIIEEESSGVVRDRLRGAPHLEALEG